MEISNSLMAASWSNDWDSGITRGNVEHVAILMPEEQVRQISILLIVTFLTNIHVDSPGIFLSNVGSIRPFS